MHETPTLPKLPRPVAVPFDPILDLAKTGNVYRHLDEQAAGRMGTAMRRQLGLPLDWLSGLAPGTKPPLLANLLGMCLRLGWKTAWPSGWGWRGAQRMMNFALQHAHVS